MNSALEELKQYGRWVNWEWHTTAKGEKTKVPINPVTGGKASSTNPSTWSTYDVARTQSPQVGFMLARPFAGVDLDGCRNAETGEIAPAALRIIARLASYTEVSPSGTGVKLWLHASLPEGSRNQVFYDWEKDCVRKSRAGKKTKVEVFDRARYFVFTGEHLGGTPASIEDRQAELEELEELLVRLFPPNEHTQNRPPDRQPPAAGAP